MNLVRSGILQRGSELHASCEALPRILRFQTSGKSSFLFHKANPKAMATGS